ncbi:adenosine deaminase, partial [bacterium]|nr:adenosine deaminase [bacterium]
LEVVAHAGETDGEKSMVDAIELLKVSRIAHCLGIEKSSRLEEKILEEKITLDLCPWSNVATGSLSCIEDHPLPEYIKRGYSVTLNSDDPGMFSTSLKKEFETMAESRNLTRFQLADLSRNAVSGSFLPFEKKERLHGEINEYQRKFEMGSN